MLDINSLSVDPVAAEEGTWANFMGARFLIARHNSDRANQLRSTLTLERWDEISAGGEKAEELAREIGAKVIAGAILLDWQSVGDKGVEIPYSAEVGYQYLSDPRFRDLLMFVENYSMNRANHRERSVAEVADAVKSIAVS
jgi:hypothetical protein